MYRLEFLPSAMQDMTEITRYISHELSNPTAAEKIADEMIEVAEKLAEFPYAHPLYYPIRPLQHEYRKLIVHNYILFYWINEENKVVTIARVVYGKRDYIYELK